jgi:hypothetical protein
MTFIGSLIILWGAGAVWLAFLFVFCKLIAFLELRVFHPDPVPFYILFFISLMIFMGVLNVGASAAFLMRSLM